MGVGLIRLTGEAVGKFLREGIPAIRPLKPLTDVRLLSACVTTDPTGLGREMLELIVSSPDLRDPVGAGAVPVLELEYVHGDA